MRAGVPRIGSRPAPSRLLTVHSGRPPTVWAMARPVRSATSRPTACNATARGCRTSRDSSRRTRATRNGRTRGVRTATRRPSAMRATACPCPTARCLREVMRRRPLLTRLVPAVPWSPTARPATKRTSILVEPQVAFRRAEVEAHAGSPFPSSELLSKLTLVLLDPASNIKAAFLLYGSIALALDHRHDHRDHDHHRVHEGGRDLPSPRERRGGRQRRRSEAHETPHGNPRAPRCRGRGHIAARRGMDDRGLHDVKPSTVQELPLARRGAREGCRWQRRARECDLRLLSRVRRDPGSLSPRCAGAPDPLRREPVGNSPAGGVRSRDGRCVLFDATRRHLWELLPTRHADSRCHTRSHWPHLRRASTATPCVRASLAPTMPA